jgi:hypothetical protein
MRRAVLFLRLSKFTQAPDLAEEIDVQLWGENDRTPPMRGEQLVEWAGLTYCVVTAAAQAYRFWLWVSQ